MFKRQRQSELFRDVLINGTGNAESPAVDLTRVTTEVAVMIKAVSATGDADVKLEYAISPDHGGTFPSASYDDYTDIIASTNTDFAANKEGWHSVTLPSLLTDWAKFKVTGVGANPVDTLVSAKFIFEEDA